MCTAARHAERRFAGAVMGRLAMQPRQNDGPERVQAAHSGLVRVPPRISSTWPQPAQRARRFWQTLHRRPGWCGPVWVAAGRSRLRRRRRRTVSSRACIPREAEHVARRIRAHIWHSWALETVDRGGLSPCYGTPQLCLTWAWWLARLR
jgi:hypothetical protein